jgi:RHS repeat-associated protein
MDSNGNNRNPNATAFNNRFLFTGREYAATYRGTYVSTFSFYEYRARAYDPTLGRFMSEDPKLFAAGDYNLFRYCHNDPEDMTDPMGTDFHALSGHITPELLAYVTTGLGPTDAYARVMGLVQMAMTANLGAGAGAITIGKAGFQLSNALGSNGRSSAAPAQARNDMKVLPKVTPHDPADSHLRPGEKSTTEASLTDPVAVEGREGMIVRQLLPIDVYFAKNASWADRGKEMGNVFSLKTWAEDDVARIVAPLRNVRFANPDAAAAAMAAVVRRDFNRTYFNLKMKDLGENIIVE